VSRSDATAAASITVIIIAFFLGIVDSGLSALVKELLKKAAS